MTTDHVHRLTLHWIEGMRQLADEAYDGHKHWTHEHFANNEEFELAMGLLENLWEILDMVEAGLIRRDLTQ